MNGVDGEGLFMHLLITMDVIETTFVWERLEACYLFISQKIIFLIQASKKIITMRTIFFCE